MNIDCLPESLRKRVRWVAKSASQGEFVLCWLHNALRAHENPALDVAIVLARHHGLPLLVYHGLSEDYRFNCDRLHAFMLQGHRDLQKELAERGIDSFFHLQREGHRGPHLRALTQRAAALVTDEMPVQPIAGWLESLAEKTDTPIFGVDATCIVAAPLLDRAHTRAFKYREATKKLYAKRVSRAYDEQDAGCQIFDGDLPFAPLWLADQCLSSLIANCNIDHTIAPVLDTTGGTQAGYERWNRFKENGLSAYARKRNNAAIHDGTSRMSAYLHFGMVSPFRIAREADQWSAEKYLDELLIWRELAFHFCYHRSHLIDTMDALPDWARETLEEHADDARDADFSWESLARANTGQPLWDACQRSLLKHGELHNNLRMTWGKAFLPWTSSPQRALELSLDLNHRYALDGRDPSSYGGILWCFGQFDRPFTPPQSVLGTVRPRPLQQHQQRFDLDRYRRVVDRPIADNLPRVAIIGAGVAGLIAGRTLVDHGIEVQLVEKSRGVGGRLATRRLDSGVSLDHGAQYFTVKDKRFGRYVRSWMEDGIVSRWNGRIVELSQGEVVAEKTDTTRLVGVPGMNAIAKHLANDLEITRETLVTGLKRDANTWLLHDDHDQAHGPFDVVIVNCPPSQAIGILEEHSNLTDEIRKVKMRPCWALMLRLAGQDDLDFDGAFINEGPIAWIAKDSAKPGRRSDESVWVAHATPQWSEANLAINSDQAEELLVDACQRAIGREFQCAAPPIAHRWRYAIPENPLDTDCLWDASSGLGACGDWCGGPRVEGAFLSGAAMAGAVLRQRTIDQPLPATTHKLIQPSLLD